MLCGEWHFHISSLKEADIPLYESSDIYVSRVLMLPTPTETAFMLSLNPGSSQAEDCPAAGMTNAGRKAMITTARIFLKE
jgi:hypothetical protein